MSARRLPTPYVVEVRRRAVDSVDRHGNPVHEWAASHYVAVHGVAPGSGEDMTTRSRPDAERIDATLYAPVGADVVVEDRVVWRGDTYRVPTTPDDWSGGPWEFSAGVAVPLVRVVG